MDRKFELTTPWWCCPFTGRWYRITGDRVTYEVKVSPVRMPVMFRP